MVVVGRNDPGAAAVKTVTVSGRVPIETETASGKVGVTEIATGTGGAREAAGKTARSAVVSACLCT